MKPMVSRWSLFALVSYMTLSGLSGIVRADDATPPAAAPAAAAPAAAAAPTPPPKVDSGDTSWVLTSSALVLIMTPGLAFFYGGMVRKKNVLSILQQCFMAIALVSVQWMLFGYSLAFGPSVHGIIGNLSWFALKGVGLDPNPDYAATIPHQAFMIFQCMFAIITPALIVGGFAERMKFSTLTVFLLLWATLVYDPIAHWVWDVGGFLHKAGALDFAGGTVVHINAGMAGLAGALCLGKRVGYPKKMSPPHNIPFVVLGASLLWFGWFGFNAGSALAAGGGLATSAFVCTHMATAMAAFTWVILDLIFAGHMTVMGMVSGAVAGLVAITPAAGFVNPVGALLIGITVSMFCYAAVYFIKPRLGYDDSLDSFGVHAVGGAWGALATGLWATKAVNSAGADGFFYGNPAQFMIQVKAVLISVTYSFVMTFIIMKVLDLTMGLRVTEEEERIGLDLTQHSEAAYTLLD